MKLKQKENNNQHRYFQCARFILIINQIADKSLDYCQMSFKKLVKEKLFEKKKRSSKIIK